MDGRGGCRNIFGFIMRKKNLGEFIYAKMDDIGEWEDV